MEKICLDILSHKEFEEKIINFGKTALINFWAPWCGGCRLLDPVIDLISEKLKNKVIVGKVNVLKNKETAKKYGSRFIPTIRIFKNGAIVDTISGNVPEEIILKKLSHFIQEKK